MQNKSRGVLFWVPRILSVCFVVFLSLFSLDVFADFNGWETILGFLVHLIPSLVLLVGIVIAWRHDIFGAVMFLVVALGYIVMVGFDRHWSWYVAISGPALLVAIFFFINWMRTRKMYGK